MRSGVAAAVLAAVLGGTAAGTAGAAGARPASGHEAAGNAANTGYDVDIKPPDELSLSAPPYTVPGVPSATVTYGAQVTLLEVRDGTRALNADPPHTPVPPSFGRWVGVKLRVTNTGSQDSGLTVLRVTGTDGQTYYPQDPTMPGCAPRETYPPQNLAPGQTFTGCDAFDLPSKVGVRAVTVNYGGYALASANGQWAIIDRRPLAKRLEYVAVGDSYSSGEGSGAYDKTAPEDCHRGANAWPRQVARDLPGLLTMPADGLIACSGAGSVELTGIHVPDGQVNQFAVLRGIRPSPTLITVTIGGNDLGFADILKSCLHTACEKPGGAIPEAEAKLLGETGWLVTDYDKIAEADPRAHVVVVGYPQLFPPLHEDVVQARCKLWLSAPKLTALNKLDADLNATINTAADDAHVTYLSVAGALKGHELCTAQPWIVSLSLNTQEIGHPVTACESRIAGLVFTYLLGRFGA